jgi:site-specific DNA-methyltransferase (adenine-specific)
MLLEKLTQEQAAQKHSEHQYDAELFSLKLAINNQQSSLLIESHSLSFAAMKNNLFEGDCLEVLRRFPQHSVDMILCDLPYGTTQNAWDSVIDLPALWREYRRVIKPNGAIVLTSQGIFTAKLMLSNEAWFKYKLVWEKSKPTNFLNAKKQPLRKHEDICVFYAKPPTYNPQMGVGVAYDKGVRKNQLSGSYGDFQPAHVKSNGERYPTDVVYFKTAESEGEVWHPTQKPVELGRYLIRTFTQPGDLVLDNAFGSGSFLVAAALEGRHFCGIEKNQDVHLFKENSVDYLSVAQKRLQAAAQTLDASSFGEIHLNRTPTRK